jgi:hypothetical protein
MEVASGKTSPDPPARLTDAPAAFAALTGPHAPGKLALVTDGQR